MALHLSVIASGIKPGDEVIATPMTFCTTVNATLYVGGTPGLADIDPIIMNIDPEEIRKKVLPNAKAILSVLFAN